ncbi:MurNAc alpha-1-phosphate uridylyltransferase [Rhodobacter viridis]|uniref:MurNAc alpha-1-phosphate uridylyltransferase n=1 Tax=Rhodobacter viridis TaxID=1054202 RepID=A0A318U1E1_9RHOB|nr:nucleotidyltransferase family protein [Rhodobacter viridis]PYF11904.1 MurNAc alpha-1-phosphate uridylyltransferase [Rhodobacter viridis]
MRSTPDALMLFAAGLGTRMKELTRTRPKPLIEVAGKPLLDHALDLAREGGASRIVANAHYLADQITAHLARSEVLVSDERDVVLETGGGLRKALPLLGPGPVFTLNTDAIWTGPNVISTLKAAWDGDRMSALLALVPREAAVGYSGAGDFSLALDGRISRGEGYVYTGAQILDPAGIETISDPVFSLNLLWNRMIAEGRAYGVIHRGGWCDVGRPECLPLAEGLLSDAAR